MSETLKRWATKFITQLYLVSFYQMSSKDSPGVKFDSAPGVIIFTLAYIYKYLEIFLYLGMRHSYQILHVAVSCWPLLRMPKLYSYGHIWPRHGGGGGGTSFTMAYINKRAKMALDRLFEFLRLP